MIEVIFSLYRLAPRFGAAADAASAPLAPASTFTPPAATHKCYRPPPSFAYIAASSIAHNATPAKAPVYFIMLELISLAYFTA